MARYWVGGTAAWDGTAGTKWATTSGGAGGASVPTSSDDVFFDAASGAVTVTVSTTTAFCQNLNFTGFTGTLSGTSNLDVFGNFTLSSAMTWSHTGGLIFDATTTGKTITTAGKTIGSLVSFGTNQAGGGWTLQDAFTTTSSLTITRGTFDTGNFSVTATTLSSSNSNTRTINLGSSTVTLSGSGASVIGFATSTNLTFNAGTSQLTLTSTSIPQISVGTTAGSGVTFYNVSFTGANATSYSLNGQPCTFNNLSIAGRTSAGITGLIAQANQTINGTLTLSAGTNATMRTFVQSDTIGTTRTLTCAAVTATDIDFRDITIAGAAAPVSGTRLGDCKGNNGITFDAPKTVYWNLAGSNSWSATGWATSGGGTPAVNNFPLAQDTAIFQSTSPGSVTTTTINANYNIGTIDMSARTSNTMTLATGTTTPAIYGNWINGTGTTLTGSATFALTFAGRGSQTIMSSGKTFPQQITINSPSGYVTLQDAFVTNSLNIILNAGTFDANNYNVTAPQIVSGSGLTRTIAVGSGTWTISSSGAAWNIPSATGLTVTGTGTISLTSASAKTFAGGGIQTYPTLNQGGAGALTISGSNKFANITNTYSATGATSVLFTAGTTNIFTAFNLTGTVGKVCTLGSTTTAQATLQKASTWYMGANSTNGGNNTGLTFTAGGGIDYLSVSYINGTVAGGYAGNFFAFF
jgi:hypothetical protein